MMLTIETTTDFTPEKEYCFHVLFREMLGIDFRVQWEQQSKNYTIRLANGSVLIVEDHFFQNIKSEHYLDAQYLPQNAPRFSYDNLEVNALYGLPFVENDSEDAAVAIRCRTDIFASTFFMLTRWEEFVLPDRDEHGRFPAVAAAASKFDFLDFPVVNEWADLLYRLLQELGWDKPRPDRQFSLSITCDVDHPRLWWTVAARFKTLAGSLLSRGSIGEARFWLKNFLLKSRDPYDVFNEWLDLFDLHDLQVHFNFLGERGRSSDCYYPIQHPFVRQLIEKLAQRGHSIGFHPSYESFGRPELFQSELDSVRQVSPVPINSGRQHYLRFSVPHTWQVWNAADLHWDSTLGYSEAEGFRCGICHDYPVFDFLERTMLRLREKPLLAMDVTLAQYRGYTPEVALQRLFQLREQVEKHRGEFVFLWHNSSWNTYFWGAWKEVFLRFISS